MANGHDVTDHGPYEYDALDDYPDFCIPAAEAIATDWVPYAEVIEEVFAASDLFTGGVVPRPDWRPLTRFEGQGITKDHRVTDLRYLKN